MVLVVVHGLGVGAHAATSARPRARRRRARPARPRLGRSRPTRSRRSQPERSPGNVETITSSTRSSSIDLHRRGVRVRVRDLAVRVDALGAKRRRARRAGGAPPRDARAACGSLCGQTSRKLAGPSAARARMRSSRRLAEDGLVGDHEHVRLTRPRRDVGRRRARTGGRPRACGARRAGSVRSQPDFSSGCVETISSSIGSSARMSSTAGSGPPSKTSPCAGIPAARSAATVRSSRRPAAARREFS